MKKKHYLKELSIRDELKTGSRSKEVMKVQEWLNLWHYIDPSWKYAVTVDGIYGRQTASMVQKFQAYRDLPASGVVDAATYRSLCAPMHEAFRTLPPSEKSRENLRELIISYAEQHLESSPTELNGRNEGPWVRAYMDGHDGPSFPWCVGFIQTVIDQAFSTLGLSFESWMRHTYSCDVLGEQGLANGNLVRNNQLRRQPQLMQAGDVFLIVRTPRDWTHTGIIVDVEGDWLHTIEGNTNVAGSREGIEVRRRMRNFMKSNIDILQLS